MKIVNWLLGAKLTFIKSHQEKIMCAHIKINIVVLVLMIAIIVSVMGTWMVLDKISDSNLPTPFDTIVTGNSQGNIALNIEYDSTENQTQEKRVE